MDSLQVNVKDAVQRAIKYLIEGFAVALAAYYIPQKEMDMQEVAMIAITAAATFAIWISWHLMLPDSLVLELDSQLGQIKLVSNHRQRKLVSNHRQRKLVSNKTTKVGF